MKTKVYSVFDSKVGVFNVPFFMVNDGAAIRAFTDLCNDPNTSIFKHPEDYSLFLIAEYDDSTGEIFMLNHSNLGVAAAYKELFSRQIIRSGEVKEAVQ